MTETQENQERSVPKPVFTDAEAGAKTFPDSTKRNFNYYTPAKRKQSRYEDVTVEVQPDPRHYLAQGWLYGFSDGRGGYPLDWTALKAWGSDRPEPERYPGSGGKGYDWPALGWHEFRDPNEEWELTLYRYNANVVRQLNQNVDVARQTKAFEQWSRNWVRFVESHVGAWMHVDHGLGLYLFANANRRAPTNMHNNAISVNSMHRIRSAQDLALYNLTLSEEIEGFDGTAHLTAWNEDPVWQGVREVAEQLTAIDDWCEAIFAANVVFEPLVGELFRSRLVMQSAPRNGDFVHPDGHRRRGVRLRRAGPALHHPDVPPAHQRPRVRRPQQGPAGQAGCPPGPAGRMAAARTMQSLWSLPDAKPPRFEDSPGRRQEPLRRHSQRCQPRRTEGARPSDHLPTPREPVQVRPHRLEHGRVHADEQPGRGRRRPGPGEEGQRQGHVPAVDDPRRRRRARSSFDYDEISEALGYEPGYFDAAEFEENMSTHYGRMIHQDDRTIMFANPEDAADYLGFDLVAKS